MGRRAPHKSCWCVAQAGPGCPALTKWLLADLKVTRTTFAAHAGKGGISLGAGRAEGFPHGRSLERGHQTCAALVQFWIHANRCASWRGHGASFSDYRWQSFRQAVQQFHHFERGLYYIVAIFHVDSGRSLVIGSLRGHHRHSCPVRKLQRQLVQRCSCWV